MRRPAISLVLVTLLIASACAQWELYWSDEFDQGSLDPEKWWHECTAAGGGNEEFQLYTNSSENSWVADGKLYLKPTLLRDVVNPKTGQPFGEEFVRTGTLDLYDLYGYCTKTWNEGCYREGNGEGQWTSIPPTASAKIWSHQRFAFRYGRVEVLAKMPVGDWMWPAIWFLPESKCYGEWPVSGEMDLVEIVGNEDLKFPDGSWHGIQRMGSTMHWGISQRQNKFFLTGENHYNETSDYGRNFHLYAMEWTPNGLSFFIDDYLFLQVPDPPIDQNPGWEGFYEYGRPWFNSSQNPWANSNDPLLAPFDCKFYLQFNIAVGGTRGYISDDAINRGGEYPKPWVNGVPQFEGMNRFYDSEADWYWTWTKEDEGGLANGTMQVEYVRVYKRSDLPPESDNDCPPANNALVQ